MVKIRERLASDIFFKEAFKLNPSQIGFLNLQEKEYLKYRAEIREIYLPLTHKIRMSSYEYDMIEDLFFRRVPLFCILNGIRSGAESADKYNKPIISLGFFRSYIYVEFKKYKREVLAELSERFEDKVDRWFYSIYEMIKKGELDGYNFDPYLGYVI